VSSLGRAGVVGLKVEAFPTDFWLEEFFLDSWFFAVESVWGATSFFRI